MAPSRKNGGDRLRHPPELTARPVPRIGPLSTYLGPFQTKTSSIPPYCDVTTSLSCFKRSTTDTQALTSPRAILSLRRGHTTLHRSMPTVPPSTNPSDHPSSTPHEGPAFSCHTLEPRPTHSAPLVSTRRSNGLGSGTMGGWKEAERGRRERRGKGKGKGEAQ
ncbi:hypothetical protein FA13DRAFT_1165701 [Coprinellus micaceus]|uniref:Uncharacterized protein n=1 Tax=Coprinellus micaceus TaxID=71717 RepID=A0A4Y7SU17_COPMI|nr:hypothetical protein FA13DRAFT_1165701 [Coprinellus micaceus]